MFSHFRKTPIAIALSTLILVGCGESTDATFGPDYDTGNQVDTEFNEQALVNNIATNIITPLFATFKNVVDVQYAQVGAYCSAVKAGSVGSSLDDAKASWRDTMLVWQQAEMMQVEPLIENDGKLRNDIYSWPDVFTCGVDQDTLYFMDGEFNGQPYDIESRRANRKGLYALEYLLFNESTGHSCQVVEPDGWSDLTPEQVVEARCEYATEVARALTDNAQQLENGWATFSSELMAAGQEGSQFASIHDAVNHLSDAMFYLDSISKDAKLATPLGLVANTCGSQACPEDVESKFANHSVENLIQNLQGFNQFFTGGDEEQSVGFVDYLNFVGDTETAETMSAAINTAIAQLQAYQSTLADTLANNEADVEQTHANVKAVTDKLKTDFIQSLALELPQTSAGDND